MQMPYKPYKHIILVTGLPGSGKTFYSKILNSILPDSCHLNADIIRANANDWDFSIEGRIRQAHRMKDLAGKSTNSIVLLDFICPTVELRKIIQPDVIFYIKRPGDERYPDTNSLYEPPTMEEASYFFTIS